MKYLILALALCLSVEAKTRTFTVTAYCPCEKCCSVNTGGPTASGKWPKSGITVAAPRWMRFGTQLSIPGVGKRVVQDRLALAYDGRIDVFVNTHAEAVQFGSKRLKVTY